MSRQDKDMQGVLKTDMFQYVFLFFQDVFRCPMTLKIIYYDFLCDMKVQSTFDFTVTDS